MWFEFVLENKSTGEIRSQVVEGANQKHAIQKWLSRKRTAEMFAECNSDTIRLHINNHSTGG